MRTQLSICTLAALALGSSAFAPVARSSTRVQAPSPTAVFETTPRDSAEKVFADLKSRVDLGSLNDSVSAMKENAMSGEVGGRGEAWTIGIAGLVFSIVIGQVPVIGGLATLLFGPGLLVAGLALLVLGITDLGDAFSPWPKPTNSPLVTTGIYEKLRHPIYAGVLATLAGVSVATDSASRLLLTGILFYVMDLVSTKEDESLAEQYPEEYGMYASKVPGKFLPADLFDDVVSQVKDLKMPKFEEKV